MANFKTLGSSQWKVLSRPQRSNNLKTKRHNSFKWHRFDDHVARVSLLHSCFHRKGGNGQCLSRDARALLLLWSCLCCAFHCDTFDPGNGGVKGEICKTPKTHGFSCETWGCSVHVPYNPLRRSLNKCDLDPPIAHGRVVFRRRPGNWVISLQFHDGVFHTKGGPWCLFGAEMDLSHPRN